MTEWARLISRCATSTGRPSTLQGEDIRVIGGDFGPCTVPADFPSPCVSRIGGTARRVVVDGATFHDMRPLTSSIMSTEWLSSGVRRS